MINNNRVICVIPARKGSTRIKNKNIINFIKNHLSIGQYYQLRNLSILTIFLLLQMMTKY